MVAFERNLLIENGYFSQFLLLWLWCQCFWVQKISTRTLLELYQLTKTATFIATPMKKTYLAVYYLLSGVTSLVFVFSLQIKMSNLLYVGLVLIISKVFTIVCLLCLCRNREEPGSFQDKTVISKLCFQMSTQVKLEGRPFWSGQGVQIYHLNYLLPTYSGNVNYYKSVNYPIPTLPVGTGSTLTIFKTNQ